MLALFTVCLAAASPRQNVVLPAAASAAAAREKAEALKTADRGQKLIACNHFDAEIFYKNVTLAEEFEIDVRPIGFTSPHYQPAMYLTASLCKTASAKGGYDTVVVIGPDHKGTGGGVVVSESGFDTPFGSLTPDRSFTERVMKHPSVSAKIDDDFIERDHAAVALMPYVKYYFPKARAAAVLLSKSCDNAALTALADILRDAGDARSVLVLLSIDFSHYQSPAEAERRDADTLEIIGSRNIARLRNLDGANLDSPESMSVMLFLLNQYPQRQLTLLAKAAIPYRENGLEYTGSYFIFGM